MSEYRHDDSMNGIRTSFIHTLACAPGPKQLEKYGYVVVA